MRLITDDEALKCGVILDREHSSIDLTYQGLGSQLLDYLVQGMLRSHENYQSPEGVYWPALAASTVQRKGSTLIGIYTGRSRITDPSTYLYAPRDIRRREAWWKFPDTPIKRWKQCHGWQNGVDRNNLPARRLIGWSRGAQIQVTDRLKDAEFEARS